MPSTPLPPSVPGRALGTIVRARGGLPVSHYFRPSTSPHHLFITFAQFGPQRSAALRQISLMYLFPHAPSPPPCCAHSAALNEVLRSVKVGFADYWCNFLQVCVRGGSRSTCRSTCRSRDRMAGRFLPAETPPIHTCVLAPRTSALSLCPPPQVWPLDREWFLAADIALHLRIFSPFPLPPPRCGPWTGNGSWLRTLH